jgi:hypothetical protein
MKQASQSINEAQEQVGLTTTRLWNLKHTIEYSGKANRQIGSIISRLDAAYRQLNDCKLQLDELGADG